MDISWVKGYLGRNLLIALPLFALVYSCFNLKQQYAWAGIAASIIGLVIVFFLFRTEKFEVTEREWFDNIIKNLDDAGKVQIYLRSFVHPELFEGSNRENLLKIMNLFVQKIIDCDGDIQIIAYQPNETDVKCPKKWITDEIEKRINDKQKAEELAWNSVKIIKRQPSANSSTIYIIDENFVIYNYSYGLQKMRYYCLDLSRSVVPSLISSGFSKLYYSE